MPAPRKPKTEEIVAVFRLMETDERESLLERLNDVNETVVVVEKKWRGEAMKATKEDPPFEPTAPDPQP